MPERFNKRTIHDDYLAGPPTFPYIGPDHPRPPERAECYRCEELAEWNVMWSWPERFDCEDLCQAHVFVRLAELLLLPGSIESITVGRELEGGPGKISGPRDHINNEFEGSD